MHKITFHPSQKKIEVPTGTSLYDAAIQSKLPVASSCNGQFTCGKCNMQVLAGGENTSPQTPEERDLLAREKKPLNHRISCVTTVNGDCTVTTTYW